MLWMRAIHLQEEARVLELVQLSDWITALEPQFTTVWAFHAWNMAYNVSITTDLNIAARAGAGSGTVSVSCATARWFSIRAIPSCLNSAGFTSIKSATSWIPPTVISKSGWRRK